MNETIEDSHRAGARALDKSGVTRQSRRGAKLDFNRNFGGRRRCWWESTMTLYDRPSPGSLSSFAGPSSLSRGVCGSNARSATGWAALSPRIGLWRSSSTGSLGRCDRQVIYSTSRPRDPKPIPQIDDERIEIVWQGRLDADVGFRERMLESERLGMKGLAMELRFGSRAILGTIDRVADDRMADIGHVDADLVGPAGLEPAGDERRHGAEPFDVRDSASPRASLRRRRVRLLDGGRRDRSRGRRLTVPELVATEPSTTARYCRSMSWALNSS